MWPSPLSLLFLFLAPPIGAPLRYPRARPDPFVYAALRGPRYRRIPLITTTHSLTLTECEADALVAVGPLVEDPLRGFVNLACATLALPHAGWIPVEPIWGEVIAFESPREPGRLAFDRLGIPRCNGIGRERVARIVCGVEAQIVQAFIALEIASASLAT